MKNLYNIIYCISVLFYVAAVSFLSAASSVNGTENLTDECLQYFNAIRGDDLPPLMRDDTSGHVLASDEIENNDRLNVIKFAYIDDCRRSLLAAYAVLLDFLSDSDVIYAISGALIRDPEIKYLDCVSYEDIDSNVQVICLLAKENYESLQVDLANIDEFNQALKKDLTTRLSLANVYDEFILDPPSSRVVRLLQDQKENTGYSPVTPFWLQVTVECSKAFKEIRNIDGDFRSIFSAEDNILQPENIIIGNGCGVDVIKTYLGDLKDFVLLDYQGNEEDVLATCGEAFKSWFKPNIIKSDDLHIVKYFVKYLHDWGYDTSINEIVAGIQNLSTTTPTTTTTTAPTTTTPPTSTTTTTTAPTTTTSSTSTTADASAATGNTRLLQGVVNDLTNVAGLGQAALITTIQSYSDNVQAISSTLKLLMPKLVNLKCFRTINCDTPQLICYYERKESWEAISNIVTDTTTFTSISVEDALKAVQEKVSATDYDFEEKLATLSEMTFKQDVIDPDSPSSSGTSNLMPRSFTTLLILFVGTVVLYLF